VFLLLLKSLLLPSSSASEDFFKFCIIHVFLFLLIVIVIIIIRPHRCTMYDAACCYRPSSVVCPSVGRSVTIMSCAKTAEPIEMPFGIWTRVGPVKHALCGVHSAHWRNLTNTVHVRRQFGLLSNYFDHLLLLLLSSLSAHMTLAFDSLDNSS